MLRYIPLAAVFFSLAGAPAVAQTGQTGYFLTRLGQDTIALEQFSLDAQGFRGSCVVRSPRTTVREYSARFNAEGNLENFHVISTPSNGAPANDREFVYSDDSVHVTVKQDTSTTRYTVAAQGRPLPFFIDLFEGWQFSLQRALKRNDKQFGVLSSKHVLSYAVEGSSPGALELKNPDGDFGPIHVEVGKEGGLERFDMTATTDKFVVERIPSVDVKAMAKEFAERERSGHALGVLSPRDTVRAEINGAHLMVDYGRPAVRGRIIFGQIVPWDSIWRTGANAATQLITDKEIQFGSITVPPGTYSLFTLPEKDRWLLVINSQHGQWGTNYDRSKDLARLPLDIKNREDLVERFTFGIDPDARGGLLRFEWEHITASIPFTVK